MIYNDDIHHLSVHLGNLDKDRETSMMKPEMKNHCADSVLFFYLRIIMFVA